MKQCLATTVLLVSLVGCHTTSPALNEPIDRSTDGIKPEFRTLALASASPDLAVKAPPPSTADSVATDGLKLDPDARIKPEFNNAPDYPDGGVVPGQVTVIFKDELKVRRGLDKKVKSLDPAVSDAINEILMANDLRARNDFDEDPIGASTTKNVAGKKSADEKEWVAEAYWKTDIPNLQSMFTLQFAADADTKAIAKALRRLPYVRTAYRSPVMVPAGFPVARTVPTVWASSPSSTGDPDFAQPDVDHYWFNRHRVYDAWQSYDFTNTAYVAAIDSGFDTSAYALDRPNYAMEQAQAWASDGTPLGPDVTEPSTSAVASHGTSVASLLASPRGNGQGLCGVFPGARVVPLKATSVAAVVKAIDWAMRSSAKVTNISLSTPGTRYPLNWDPSVRAAISTATAAGHSVVLAAGNVYHNLDNFSPPSDGGAIIVGGTDKDLGWAWHESASYGSSHGSSVHLAASAKAIKAPVYIPAPPPGVPQRSYDYWEGTSFAAPMVAATVAMARDAYKRSGGTAWDNDIAYVMRTLMWGSANISVGRYGELLGYGMNDRARNQDRTSASVRDLNVKNALILAKLHQGQPIVRIFNIDNTTWFTTNYNWSASVYKEEAFMSDAIWDMRGDAAQPTDTLSFSTYNSGGYRTHGYQVWRVGKLFNESIGGTVEARRPDGTVLHGSSGEDNYATDAGWHYTLGFPWLQ